MDEVASLKTDRFTLRPLRREDAAALFPTFADEAQCFYLSRPAFTSEEELWGWLAETGWNGRTWIAEDDCGEVTGRFVAIPGHEAQVNKVGYTTVIHRQGEGIARECMEMLVNHLFAEGHRKLIAEIDAENIPSLRLIEALGFTREALFREQDTTHAGMRDLAVYGLLASESN